MISILTCQVESSKGFKKKDDSQEKDGGVDNSSPADESAKVEETKEADPVPKSEDMRMNLICKLNHEIKKLYLQTYFWYFTFETSLDVL